MGQYVLTSLCSWGNVVWGVVLLPYLVLAVQAEVGVWAMLYTLFILCLVNVASAQWYGVVRTLVNIANKRLSATVEPVDCRYRCSIIGERIW